MASNQLVLKLEPQEEICEESIAELDALLDTEEKDVFSCSQCDKAFTSDKRLREHARRAHKGRSFPCSVCAHVAKRRDCLKKHERQVHRGEGRDHVCPHCQKAFTAAIHLADHIRTHTGEKPFVCNVCAKGFSQKGTLKKHQLIHSGERPFTCKVCGQSFNRQHHLKIHQRIHTGEKPCKCKWCEKRFTYSSHLTRHESTHTGEKPFEMASNQLVLKVEPQEICEKSVSELDVQLAPQEKDVFSCSQCQLAFTSDDLLQEHTTRAHEGQKFACSSCTYVAKNSWCLKKHEGLLRRVRGGNHVCPHCNKTFNNVM